MVRSVATTPALCRVTPQTMSLFPNLSDLLRNSLRQPNLLRWVPKYQTTTFYSFSSSGGQILTGPTYSWPPYQWQCPRGEGTVEADGRSQNSKAQTDKLKLLFSRCASPATCTATSRWVGRCSSTLPTTCFMQGRQRNKEIDNIKTNISSPCLFLTAAGQVFCHHHHQASC